MENDDFIEFDSLINFRPRQNNRSREVENPEMAEKAFFRAQELIFLTIKYGRKGTVGRNSFLREICRVREFYIGAFLASDFSTLSYLDRYFSQFAAICRN